MKFYGIKSSNQIIDVNQINLGCDRIDKEAVRFSSAAKLVDQASAVLNKDALSVDNATMQSTVDEVADALRNLEKMINQSMDSIRSTASTIYKNQRSEYNNYLQSEHEKEKAQNNTKK